MKIIAILTVLGMMMKLMMGIPEATLPSVRVCGTMRVKEHTVYRTMESRNMPRKMYYLKTGRSVSTERNHKKHQNYWGKGNPSRVLFPAHLAGRESFRRVKKV